MTAEAEKLAAARRAVALVEDGTSLGLGSGSTAALVVKVLGERVRAGLRVRAIPSSPETRALALAAGIPLVTFAEVPLLDLTIDGADEVDPRGRMIKGRGGALLHEKILAAHSRRLMIVVDGSKRVAALGARAAVPVEVIPLAAPVLAPALLALGGQPALRRGADGEPTVTAEGNHILDAHFGAIADPAALAARLDGLVGAVEHGLFVGFSPTVLVGDGEPELLPG
jgi:ribose 5-phosphate isomerase A